MSDEPGSQAHPYEALAPYVDGTADQAERSAVEAHLEACDRCRRDVALATAGRSAIRSLPEAEPPGVAAAVSATLGLRQDADAAEDRSSVADLQQRRARRWQAVWGAGLGAAALLAGVLIYLGVVSGGGGGEAALAPSASREAAGSQAAITTESVDSLVRNLASSRSTGGAPEASPAPAFTSAPLAGDSAGEADTCVRTAGGIDASAEAIDLFEGTFQETPVYVGAYETGGTSPRIVAVVASQDDCQPLYLANQRI